MQNSSLLIEPSLIEGTISGSPSKSHAIRSLLFASIADGESHINNLPESPDIEATIAFCKSLGATFSGSLSHQRVVGVANIITKPKKVHVGNSGLLLRLATPFLAMLPGTSTITGDRSIQTLRQTGPLVSALKQLGASISSNSGNDRPPLHVEGPIRPGVVKLEGNDSQPVSALLIASSILPGKSEIFVNNPGERPWIDLTLSWLDRFHVAYKREGYDHYTVEGNHRYNAFDYTVPSDLSSLSFLLAAAMITNSQIKIEGFDWNEVQGDAKVIDLFTQFGGSFKIDRLKGSIEVLPTKELKGISVDVNDCIDALPILAVVGAAAKGKTELYNGSIARHKESDRIRTIVKELKRMGAKIEEREDGLVVEESKLIGATVMTHQDHRIAMSLAVAGLVAKGQTLVKGVACIPKSYPGFVKDFLSLGANIRKVK